MSDFWQAEGGAPIINLEQVVAVARDRTGKLVVHTTAAGVTVTLDAEGEAAFLAAVGNRIGTNGSASDPATREDA